METLSDDIREITDIDVGGDYLAIHDVKRFIRKLKKEFTDKKNQKNLNPLFKLAMAHALDMVNSRAGKELLDVVEKNDKRGEKNE